MSTCLPGISLERGCVIISFILVVRGLALMLMLFVTFVTLRKSALEWNFLLALGQDPEAPAVIFAALTVLEFVVNYFIIRKNGQTKRHFLLLWLCEYIIYTLFLLWWLLRVFRSGEGRGPHILQGFMLMTQIVFMAVFTIQYRNICKNQQHLTEQTNVEQGPGIEGIENPVLVTDEPDTSRDLPPSYDQCADKKVLTRSQSEIDRINPPPSYNECVVGGR